MGYKIAKELDEILFTLEKKSQDKIEKITQKL